MHVETGKFQRPDKSILVDSVWAMLFGPLIEVSCGICHIDRVDLMQFLAKSHQKVCGLDISVHKVFVMHKLDR